MNFTGNDNNQFGSANYDFSFLDNYIRSITAPGKTNPNQFINDNNGFYEESNINDGKNEGGPSTKSNNQSNFLGNSIGDYIHNNNVDSNIMNDYPNQNYNNRSKLSNSISNVESQGDYGATNQHSSATGKYQFLWSAWGNSIKKVTGVKTRQEFLRNPDAQEQFYSFYEKNYLLPKVREIRNQIDTNLSDAQLAKLIHFRGAAGAKRYLKGQLNDKPESYNMAISKYIGSRQTGGIALTPEEQQIGLNNQMLDSLVMPLNGYNTIRGLDSGEPVKVWDDFGNTDVLYGPDHTIKMKGTVYEKRLKRK